MIHYGTPTFSSPCFKRVMWGTGVSWLVMKLFMQVSNHKPLMFDRFDMKDDCIYVILYGTVASNPTKWQGI